MGDYEDDPETETPAAEAGAENGAAKQEGKVKGNYVSIHSSGFRDFLLKPEVLRAIVDCGFEHPSEIQHECIPQAVMGMDILSQAKSGMGKTAVFVLATLQQIEPVDGQVSVLVMCHTRELAFQISKEYERFSKFLPAVKVGVFFGGLAIAKDEQVLKNNCPHIVVGTPGRILALIRSKKPCFLGASGVLASLLSFSLNSHQRSEPFSFLSISILAPLSLPWPWLLPVWDTLKR